MEQKKNIGELTEKDFEGAPLTVEAEGVFQFIVVDGKYYFRNVDTGEITQ